MSDILLEGKRSNVVYTQNMFFALGIVPTMYLALPKYQMKTHFDLLNLKCQLQCLRMK